MSVEFEHEPGCGVCSQLRDEASRGRVLFENELWQVRTTGTPTPVPGWVMLLTRRHVAGPAQFDQREALSFGPTLAHLQRALLEVTGALRIYTAAMGESSPHFHAHSVPRYAVMPKEAKAWSVFDLQRAAAAGEYEVDEVEASRVSAALARALSASPLPLAPK
jgi:diadenosine tetraphosphate (Ap4A) HIT family hydrolase